MTNHERQANEQINSFLQASLALEKRLIQKKDPVLASLVQRLSSELADLLLNVTGVRKALHAYWQERKALAKEVV